MRRRFRAAVRAKVLLASARLGALLLASLLGVGLPWIARAAPPDGLEVLHGSEADAGFALAQGQRAFVFPADHGPHPQFRHEWWYFTGRLRAADGEQFGFELTFFRLGVAPPVPTGDLAAAAAPQDSRWRARQVYAAHFAVTDLARRNFHAHARYARDALGLGESRAAPLSVRVQDWSLTEVTPDAATATATPAPKSASASNSPSPAARWRLQADDGAYAVDLTALIAGAPVLNGVGGLSLKSDVPGAASWYYSLPRLPLQGTLRREGRTLTVSGEAWLDREWGSGGLGPQQQGWDWYALQLSDGSALMFYALRDATGRPDAHSAGTFIDAQGGVHALRPQDVQLASLSHWDSPRGGRYPAHWQLAVPSLELALDINPALADQELPTQPRYWEGAVDANGRHAGQAIRAQGYVELVGYAR